MNFGSFRIQMMQQAKTTSNKTEVKKNSTSFKFFDSNYAGYRQSSSLFDSMHLEPNFKLDSKKG